LSLGLGLLRGRLQGGEAAVVFEGAG
jgi:hypothetical protein